MTVTVKALIYLFNVVGVWTFLADNPIVLTCKLVRTCRLSYDNVLFVYTVRPQSP